VEVSEAVLMWVLEWMLGLETGKETKMVLETNLALV
jgi:hypothetical protein